MLVPELWRSLSHKPVIRKAKYEIEDHQAISFFALCAGHFGVLAF
jgi:hypothetical protein